MSQYTSIHGDKAKAMVGCWDGVNFVVGRAEADEQHKLGFLFCFGILANMHDRFSLSPPLCCQLLPVLTKP